jgi:transposase-like protein
MPKRPDISRHNGDIVPVPGAQFEETLASASPDVLRAMIREFAQRMMDADVEVACNAGYGEVTPDRVNSRNGYSRRERDTRAGTRSEIDTGHRRVTAL